MSLNEPETTEVEGPRCHGTQVEQLLSAFIAKATNWCQSF